ncbi:hypothetical protein BKA80DRAFT_258860 [Phyllosticta citrichinensis]
MPPGDSTHDRALQPQILHCTKDISSARDQQCQPQQRAYLKPARTTTSTHARPLPSPLYA